MANRYKFPKHKIKALLRGIEIGASITSACNAAGLSYTTLKNWRAAARSLRSQIKHGEITKADLRPDQLKLLKICDAFKKADAKGQVYNIEIIRSVAQGGEKNVEKRVNKKKVWNPSIQKMEEVVEVTLVERISPKNWIAAARMLEWQDRQHYGRYVKHEQVKPEKKLAPDERKRRLEKLLKSPDFRKVKN